MINAKNKSNCEFFNIGTGNGLSVLELVNTFQKVNEVKVNYQIVDRRPGDVVAVYADTTLANNELGWKAESTNEETLASAWKWEKKIRGIK